MTQLHNIKNLINRTCIFISSLFFLLALTSVFLQVLSREFPFMTFSWGEEIGRYAFIYAALFGSVVLVSENNHLKLTIFFERMPQKYSNYFQKFYDLITILFLIILAYLAYLTIIHVIPSKTPALRISLAYIYLSMPICFILMFFQIVINFLIDKKENQKL